MNEFKMIFLLAIMFFLSESTGFYLRKQIQYSHQHQNTHLSPKYKQVTFSSKKDNLTFQSIQITFSNHITSVYCSFYDSESNKTVYTSQFGMNRTSQNIGESLSWTIPKNDTIKSYQTWQENGYVTGIQIKTASGATSQILGKQNDKETGYLFTKKFKSKVNGIWGSYDANGVVDFNFHGLWEVNI